MAIEYNSIVPWGRSYDEYVKMFDLKEKELTKKILGCGDGPASFNSVVTKNGGRIISFDPIYQFSKEQIQDRINETFNLVIKQTADNPDKFIWKNIKDIHELGKIRMNAMHSFIEDYELGKIEKRYIYGELPNIPITDETFDIALISHFLFLYSDNLSFDFHKQSINSILNVAGEVRIFPLLDYNSTRSIYVEKIENYFSTHGFFIEERVVNYEFQKNGNTMLRIWS